MRNSNLTSLSCNLHLLMANFSKSLARKKFQKFAFIDTALFDFVLKRATIWVMKWLIWISRRYSYVFRPKSQSLNVDPQNYRLNPSLISNVLLAGGHCRKWRCGKIVLNSALLSRSLHQRLQKNNRSGLSRETPQVLIDNTNLPVKRHRHFISYE